jgi:hypothetical protein
MAFLMEKVRLHCLVHDLKIHVDNSDLTLSIFPAAVILPSADPTSISFFVHVLKRSAVFWGRDSEHSQVSV